MDVIHIYKAQRLLCLLRDGNELFCCGIGLGQSPTGHKGAEGDGRTPEGEYRICTRNDRSKYTLFLGLNYPRPADAQAAFAASRVTESQFFAILNAHKLGKRPPWDTPLGGQIGIHGGGISEGAGLADSTAGCIALLDSDIRMLWELAPMDITVNIYP